MQNIDRVLAAMALVLVAGCSEPAATTTPAASAAPSVQRQPGSWNMVHYVMAFEGTGLTGDMAEMVKAGEASVGKKDFGGPLCLSAELAAKDNAEIRLQEIIRFGPEWKVARSNVAADGTVDFAATMDDPAQGKGEMTITGKITPTTTDLVLTTDGHMPAPGKGRIQTTIKQENRRVGDCTPGQDTFG